MEEYAYILDYLPQGRPDVPNRREPVAYAIGEDEFVLFELIPNPDAALLVGDRVYLGKDQDKREKIDRVRGRIAFDDMTHNAQSEMHYVIEDIVKANEDEYLHIYNEGGAISTRMHVLELLPGLGKKLMQAILQERKNGTFESFEGLEERVGPLHQPARLIANRIETEIKDESQKYHLYARPPSRDEHGGGRRR